MPRERESQKGVQRRKKSSPHLLLGFGANHKLEVGEAGDEDEISNTETQNRDLENSNIDDTIVRDKMMIYY